MAEYPASTEGHEFRFQLRKFFCQIESRQNISTTSTKSGFGSVRLRSLAVLSEEGNHSPKHDFLADN